MELRARASTHLVRPDFKIVISLETHLNDFVYYKNEFKFLLLILYNIEDYN